MTKLTIEQREELADMLDSGNWETVLMLCKISLEHHESRLKTCDISKNDRDLVLAKARHEGAEDMYKLLANVREHIGGAKRKEKR